MNPKLMYVGLAISILLIPALVHNSEAALIIRDWKNYHIDNPVTIQGQTFQLAGYTNKIQTTTVHNGTNLHITIQALDDRGEAQKKHVALYTNLSGKVRDIAHSNTFIVFDSGKPVQVTDPNGLFKSVKVTSSSKGQHFQLDYDITFAKPMIKSDIIISMWDQNLKVQNADLVNALEVTK
jgi:hypothetical protein